MEHHRYGSKLKTKAVRDHICPPSIRSGFRVCIRITSKI